jgi:hypothetical protein
VSIIVSKVGGDYDLTCSAYRPFTLTHTKGEIKSRITCIPTIIVRIPKVISPKKCILWLGKCRWVEKQTGVAQRRKKVADKAFKECCARTLGVEGRDKHPKRNWNASLARNAESV